LRETAGPGRAGSLKQAKKRYGLRILKYIAAPDHTHLLMLNGLKLDIIPRTLLAGQKGRQVDGERSHREQELCRDHKVRTWNEGQGTKDFRSG